MNRSFSLSIRPLFLIVLACLPAWTVIGQAAKAKQARNSKPLVIGSIDEIQSTALGETRSLTIYLPEGYNVKDTVKYPVIYVLDGSPDEDFLHIAGLVQFNSFEWINRVPKSIVVGIGTVDRRRDFTFPTTIATDRQAYPTAGHSDRFIAFLEQDLQPYIASAYKTNGMTTILGQSLGGLFLTEVLLKKPTLFDKYIIVSPSLWWDNGSLLNYSSGLLKRPLPHPIDVYIAVGKEGLTPTATPRVMEVDANLLAEKVKLAGNGSIRLHFDYLPHENHATILHQAVYNAFLSLYPSTP